MPDLDRIVYLADKVEPSRTYADLSEMRKVAEYDLEGAVKLCLGAVIDKFRKQDRQNHPLTEDLARDVGI